jgi:hypothetical protein
MPLRSLQERCLDAEVRGSRWRAEANEALERGDVTRARHCEEKAQFWLDRYNLLAGRSDRPAPRH